MRRSNGGREETEGRRGKQQPRERDGGTEIEAEAERSSSGQTER